MHELNSKQVERAILIGISLNGGNHWQVEDHLEELALLADTAGAQVVDKIIQARARIDSAYFIGKGKAECLAVVADAADAGLIIFDDDLNPAQVRNLERLTGKKILDRSGLILDIFARRAKTREARTQVELAQLKYLLPRLTRQWTHLSRQIGGIGFRGPGETQLEVDRRVIRRKIGALTKDLEKIKSQRKVRRQRRKENFKVGLVGYTNVGKSTLMNALTESEVFVENRLFATLDATVRHLDTENHQPILLVDTVGFIRKLPHHLVASFMSTLEEAKEVDMLLHVADVSHPQFLQQIAVVKDVLHQLQISHKPTLMVFNKVDRLKEKGLIPRLSKDFQPSIFVSATKGLFLNDLKDTILRMSRERFVAVELVLDVQFSWITSKLYELSDVLDTRYDDRQVRVSLKASEQKLESLKSFLQEQTHGAFKLSLISNGSKN
ncbi:MAG: GTPase HflX [bacterium]